MVPNERVSGFPSNCTYISCKGCSFHVFDLTTFRAKRPTGVAVDGSRNRTMHSTLSPSPKIVLYLRMSPSDSSTTVSDGEQQPVKHMGPSQTRWDVALLNCSQWL